MLSCQGRLPRGGFALSTPGMVSPVAAMRGLCAVGLIASAYADSTFSKVKARGIKMGSLARL